MLIAPSLIPHLSRSVALVGACCCFIAALSAEPASEPALPLPERYFPVLEKALESAVRQSPRMIGRNLEMVVADANRLEMRAGLLPSVGGYANYYPWTQDTRTVGSGKETETTSRLTYNFAISQPLYHWGTMRNNARIGELQLKIAQGQTAEVYQLMALEIRALYLQLIVKKASLARTRLGQQQVDEQLVLAKANLERNIIPPAALFGPEIAAEQARLATDRAVEDYERSKASFARLCGWTLLKEEDVPDAIPPADLPRDPPRALLSEFSASSNANTYGLKNLQRQLETARLQYENARVRLRPKLNLSVGISQDQVSYTGLPGARSGVQSFYTGATVNWSIFDGFATKAAKTGALARIRQLEQSYQDATADAREAARSRFQQLEFSARSLVLAERTLEAATGAFLARKEDLDRGLASEADVRAAEISYAGSRIETYAARSDYLMKAADFLSAVRKDPALANLPVSSP